MREQQQRLRRTLLSDGGSAEVAFIEMLKSELNAVFKQYMNVESINVDVVEGGVNIKVKGGEYAKVGFYYE